MGTVYFIWIIYKELAVDNREYKANKIFLIVAVITLIGFLFLFLFTTSKYIVAINESVKTNEMYDLQVLKKATLIIKSTTLPNLDV